RTLTLRLGKHDAAAKKVYVQPDDWPRISAVDDSLEPLATRPALAYRGKRVLDFASRDLARIDITRDGKKLALEQGPEGWPLAAPVAAEADTSKVGQLADALGRLEAAEYVNDAPKPADLGKEYGLDKPGLTATLTF